MKATAVADRPDKGWTDKDTKNATEAVGCIAWLVLFLPVLALHGWVLQILWGWFLTPWAHIEAPSIAMCLGIATLLGMFMNKPKRTKNTPSIWEIVGYELLTPVFTLAVGAGIHWFVEMGW